MRTPASLVLVLVAVAGLSATAQRNPLSSGDTRFITYAEARPVVERLAPELAAMYAAGADAQREAAWRAWAVRRNAEIRARVARGDEDSLINLLLFGTSFTTLPRALNDSSRLGGPDRAAALVRGRLADLLRALVAPNGNERLEFARDLLLRRGIDPATTDGGERARAYLLALLTRASAEVETYVRTIDRARADGRGELAVRSTLYRERGLSSDTSVRPDFAIDGALEALRQRALLPAGSVRRAAVIGPGLDFTDKAEGHDFYPQQSTQPFLLVDSLLRARLAQRDRLTLTTIDLSPRVTSHLQHVQRRGTDGNSHTLVLPRTRDERWTGDFVGFWKSTGSAIGDDVRAMSAPRGVDVRAIRVRPDILGALRVHDLNVVLERLDPMPEGERFDLVIATNVLVYYDVFEQSLALANIAAMLRTGGMLLSNNVLVELATTPIRSIGHTDAIYSDSPDDRDQIVWYQRQ